MNIHQKNSGPVALYSSLLSIAEIGLGSLLHAFYIPFRGYFLSLNQIFFLTRALSDTPKNERSFIPIYISNIAATVKSLAPVGKKLTPMLAIAAQGFLYNMGILIFNNNLIGRMIGASLSALWGFIQPFLIYSFIFGQTLMDSFSYFDERFSERFFLIFIAGCIALKITFALIIVLLTPHISESHFERYTKLLMQASEKVKAQNAEDSMKKNGFFWMIRRATKDLCRPLFLLSLFLTAIFLYFVDASPKWIIWGILRPIAVGFIFFFILRLFSIKKVFKIVGESPNGIS